MKIQSKQNPYKSAIAFMPIILMLAVVPLIVRAKIVLLDENTAKFWTGNYQIDLFSYTKTRVIMLLTVWMLVNAFFFFSKKDFKKLKENKWIFYPVIVFVFSLIVSTILSEHKNIAIWGAPERYEGMVVHLCYIIMFLYTYMTLKTEEDFKYIKYSILFLASAMAFIGIMQAFGKDILTTDLMRNFIVPKEYINMFSSVTTAGQNVYLTLQNSNYVGTYVALIIPFLLMFCISKYEHKYLRIYSGILACITLFILVKSGSKAGLFAVMCILLLLPIIFCKAILNLKKTTIVITISVIIFTVIGVNIITGNAITNNLIKIINDSKELLSKNEEYIFAPAVYDIKLEKNRIELYTQKENIYIYIGEKLVIKDSSGNLINFNYDYKTKEYDLGEFYESLKITDYRGHENVNLLSIECWGAVHYIIECMPNGDLYLVDGKLQRYEPIVADYVGFEGKENLFSDRGYIWSRTIPLILNKPIFGYGSDNFLSVFPQYDIPAKTYVYWDSNKITDKPHSIYLLYLINVGFIGFISIIILFINYVIRVVKNIIICKKFKLFEITCFLSIIAYLTTGLINDSLPTVAPIFWIIFGMGEFLSNSLEGKYENDYE